MFIYRFNRISVGLVKQESRFSHVNPNVWNQHRDMYLQYKASCITVEPFGNYFIKLVALASDLLSCSTRGLVTLPCLLPKLAAARDVVPYSARVTLIIPLQFIFLWILGGGGDAFFFVTGIFSLLIMKSRRYMVVICNQRSAMLL
jgi:hypothetical protein